jgi:hypothetical protein
MVWAPVRGAEGGDRQRGKVPSFRCRRTTPFAAARYPMVTRCGRSIRATPSGRPVALTRGDTPALVSRVVTN